MSSAETLRFHLQSLLARGLSSPAIARHLGIAGASEIWGGVEPRDRPGWYVWLHGRGGAYALELDAADGIAPGGTRLHRGHLSLRYFPNPADAEFASFSPEEQELVRTGWIDASGAPDILRAHEVPPAFFAIAAIDLVVRDVGETVAVGLGAVDRLRWSYGEDWAGVSPPLGDVRRRRGERTRDVPAWSLAWPVLSLLGGLVAQSERRAAARLVEAREPGFALVHRGGAFAPEDVDDLSHREVLVLFDGAGAPLADALGRSLAEGGAEIVGDLALAAPCGVGGGHGPLEHRSREIPRTWFPEGSAPPQLACCC